MTPPPQGRTDLAPERDWDLLQRRLGDDGLDLPNDLGRVTASFERAVSAGPLGIDVERALPASVGAHAWGAVQAIAAHGPGLREETMVLSEALAVPMCDLPLRQLDEIADALLALSTVASGAPCWATPVAADSARLVLDAHGADVERAGELQRSIYERFTDHIWEVREVRLRNATRPLRLRSRWLLRSDLAAASRTGAVPGSLRELSELVLEASAARRRLHDLSPLLERHLGRHHQGPRTDVSGAIESLASVRALQRALGDRLDVERFRGLLMAEAFTTSDLAGPALQLRRVLDAWQVDLDALGSADPWSLSLDELETWSAELADLLPRVSPVLGDVSSRRPSLPLRHLVDVLLLREHAAEMELRSVDPAKGMDAGGAS